MTNRTEAQPRKAHKKFLPIFCAAFFANQEKTIASVFVVGAIFFSVSFAYAASLININTADSAALQTLNGIGPSKAQAIIDYRTLNGPFAKKEDIQNVSGIGTATYDKIKDSITVGDGGSESIPNEPASSSGQSESNASSPVSSYVTPPSPDLYAHAGSDRLVIVGADVEFVGRAYNKEGEVVKEGIRFTWNFGDGSTAEGEKVMHHWSYPGRYAVTLDIAGGSNAASHRVIVTAESAKLSVYIQNDGAIAIKNNSARDLDLSFWLLTAGGDRFTLPGKTVLLRGETVAFSPVVTRLNKLLDGSVALLYPNGTVAVRAGEEIKAEKVAPPISSPVVPVQPSVQESKEEVEDEELSEPTETTTKTVSTTVSQLASPSSASSYPWWAGAVLISALGAGAVYFLKKKETSEWNIIDENVEEG